MRSHVSSVVCLVALFLAAGSQGASEGIHWAYAPVQRPVIPAVRQYGWARTPIDAFILARLEAKGLRPSAAADRTTFIRRATLDVWGMIPKPEDVQVFVADRSPDAYEKLIDRLLASPHYGERQARRWLDLARYADSAGFELDAPRPDMWRYRDYVINAFNQDKPYDQFVREQLAGDELASDDQEALIATGFMANYPDNPNSRDMVQRKYEITTDIADTVGTVFLAQTVGCARCHNHKFDKISQKEYFQLQAFFANLSEVRNLPAKIGPFEREYQKAQAKWHEATSELRTRRSALIDSIREPGVRYYKERHLTDTQKSLFTPESQWTPLDRWINHRLGNVMGEGEIAQYLIYSANRGSFEYSAENAEKYEEWKKLSAKLGEYAALSPGPGSLTITAMSELGQPDAPPTFVFFAGNHERPLQEVQPGFPAAIANGEQPAIVATAASSGRRTALANWIASSRNPLTARVYVNRVWSQYFGRGIVDTVSDFGEMGGRPSHPELLDYLADAFVQHGWSVKMLHREILLSSVYRQSSAHREELRKIDPDNTLLGAFPRLRLDAEQIRDSLLAASGEMNETIGGPSLAPSKGHDRRSLYLVTLRSAPDPLLKVFDMSSPEQAHSKRDVTTTPLQALALFNNGQVLKWAQALAGRVIRESAGDEPASLDRLYEILFARKPDKVEKSALLSFLDNHRTSIKDVEGTGRLVIAMPTGFKNRQGRDPLRDAAFVDLVHVVLNSNDMVYRF